MLLRVGREQGDIDAAGDACQLVSLLGDESDEADAPVVRWVIRDARVTVGVPAPRRETDAPGQWQVLKCPFPDARRTIHLC